MEREPPVTREKPPNAGACFARELECIVPQKSHPVPREIKVEVYVCGQPESSAHRQTKAILLRAGIFPEQSLLSSPLAGLAAFQTKQPKQL